MLNEPRRKSHTEVKSLTQDPDRDLTVICCTLKSVSELMERISWKNQKSERRIYVGDGATGSKVNMMTKRAQREQAFSGTLLRPLYTLKNSHCGTHLQSSQLDCGCRSDLGEAVVRRAS